VAASAGHGSTTSRTRCGIEVDGGGVDAALPQVRFNIARARDCMIEHEGEAKWCTGDKKHTTISHLGEGATATTAAILMAQREPK
jgi:hypothetical protein